MRREIVKNSDRELFIRLTAILVAAVFVLGTCFVPADLYAGETDASADSGEMAAPAAGTEEDTVLATQSAPEEAAQDPAESEGSEPGAAETSNGVMPESGEALTEDGSAGKDAAGADAQGSGMEEPDAAVTPTEEAAETSSGEDIHSEMADLLSVTDENGSSIDLADLDEAAYDGFLYKLKEDVTNKEIKKMEQAIEEIGEEPDPAAAAETAGEVEEVLPDEVYAADSIETIEEVAEADMIDYIEPDYIMTICGAPNDPAYSIDSWQMTMTNVPYIWDRGMTGAGAVVAVLDSGVNMNHEDLEGVRFVNPYNAINGGKNVSDSFGHGTAVAGIIAETRNNGIGFTGILSKVGIMPVKVLDASGRTSVSYYVKSMQYAVSKNVDVINMSVGTAHKSETLEKECKDAVKKGCILVASVGNYGNSRDPDSKKINPVMYPAGFDCVVGVGSVTRNKKHSSFSEHNNQVTVVAPGENIRILYGFYDYYQATGTSFSAPQVSALAAMVKSRDHLITPAKFMSILKSASVDLGDKGYDPYFGYGLIDFGKVYNNIMAKQLNYYSFTLSSRQYVFNGKVRTPSVTVKLGSRTLVKGTDYTLTYSKGRKAVGKYTVTVKAKNGITGTRTATFTIKPPLIKKLKAPARGKKQITVKWYALRSDQKTKFKSAITGYQVRVAKNASFKGAKYKKVKGYAKTSATVKKLKRKTTYYVQYRVYRTVGKTTYYSKWSASKKVKTK